MLTQLLRILLALHSVVVVGEGPDHFVHLHYHVTAELYVRVADKTRLAFQARNDALVYEQFAQEETLCVVSGFFIVTMRVEMISLENDTQQVQQVHLLRAVAIFDG